MRSSSSALRSVFSTASRLRARDMSMKSMTMIPPMSRSRSWRTTSSAGLEVRPRDRVLELRALAAAGERARVDVDHRHRLGVVDHQVAAAGQVDPAAQHRLERLLDVVALEQRLLVLVELEPLEQLRRRAVEERLEPVVLLAVVHDRLLELAREDVARHAHRQVGLLEDHLRRGGLLARCWSTSCSLCRYLISRSKSSLVAPWAAVRTITPPSPRSALPAARRRRSRSLSSSRRDTPTPSPCGTYTR